MTERIEKLEKEIEVIRYAYEQNKLFLESKKDQTDVMGLMNSTLETLFSHVKELNEKIIDLEDSFVLLSKNSTLYLKSIESQSRSLKILTEAIEKHQQKLNSL
jgi:uncharacterized protein YoxC